MTGALPSGAEARPAGLAEPAGPAEVAGLASAMCRAGEVIPAA